MEGRVNTCELSLNVVMSTKPKMLPGLSQKALEWVQGLDNTLSWTPNAPGGERAPHPFGSTLRNVVSPYRSCRKTGKKAVRPTDGDAGKGVGKSERRPVNNWHEYEQSLRDRGDITLWISPEAISAWRAPMTGKRGAQPIYANIAIETALALRLLFP